MSLSLALRPLVACAALALLTGCGSDDRAAPGPSSAASSAADAPGAADGGGPRQVRMPGTFGEIADVDGDVLQVRNRMTGQVAVTVTGETTVTAQAAAALADVTPGACVVVRGADTDAGASPRSSAAAITEVRAASVAVSPAGADGCADGPGGAAPGGEGRRLSELPSDRASDGSGVPGNGTGDGPGDVRRIGLGTAGQVSSVSESGFVIAGPNGDVTVTVGSDTAYTRQVPADASALTVGRCVRVDGDADDTGAVTAASIQVSDKVNDQCGL